MNTRPLNTVGTMDAPDLQTRMAARKAQLGEHLTPYDLRRIEGRRGIEAENARVASTGLARTPPTTPGAGSFWKNNGNGTATQGTFGGPQTTTGLARTPPTSNGTPPSPPALRTALTPPLPPVIPAAIQPALNSPGAVVPSPATVPQQREAVNPLSGSLGTGQTPGTTAPINPGAALGVNQRGASVPRGQDALPEDEANYGGTGLYRRKFANPKSAATYGSYVKSLFAGSSGDEDDS